MNIFLLLGFLWCLQQHAAESRPTFRHTREENGATAPELSQGWNSRREYEGTSQADTTQEYNKYISSQQPGILKSESAVKRSVGTTYQAAYLDSADFDGKYDCTLHDNIGSDMLFTHGIRRTKELHKDTSQGSEEIKLMNSGFDNSKKISGLTWQRKLSTKYPAIKEKQGPYQSMGNQFEEYGLEGTDADNEEMDNNPDVTILDEEEQNPYAYEDIPQDSEDEELSDDTRQVYDDDWSDGDDDDDDNDDHDDIQNAFAPVTEENLKSDGSDSGLQAINQHKNGVARVLKQVPHPAKTGDGTRCYKHGSNCKFSENWAENSDRTHNIIQSRIDYLKDNIKRHKASHGGLNKKLQHAIYSDF